jgi:hypothetical protein
MREKHGIAGAGKLPAAPGSSQQSVIVTDHFDCVGLHLGAGEFAATMTPEEARFIAKQLMLSAARIEAEKK